MVLTSWFLAVNVVVLAGIWDADPFSVAVNVAGAVLLLVALSMRRPLQLAVDRIATESLIYIHAFRIWGLLLLPFSGEGVAASWAIPVAFTEIALGMLALPLGYFAGAATSRMHQSLLWTWSALGLASAVLAPASAVWHAALDLDGMRALSDFPLALVPAYFMPLMITAHIVLIRRLVQGDELCSSFDL